MGKRALILYASHSGNTDKVARTFQSTFEKRGWACDVFRVSKNADDILRPPYDPADYDFLCVGSGVASHLPYNELRHVIRRYMYGIDPRIPLRHQGEDIPYITEPLLDLPRPGLEDVHAKIVLGPDSKPFVVFATYAGYEFGPAEAQPALELLKLEVEHLRFRCVGQFCCPGQFLNHPTPKTFHGDIRGRPNEEDLRAAEAFLDERLAPLEA